MSTDHAARLAHFAEEWKNLQARAEDAREALAQAARDASAEGVTAYRIRAITGAAPDTVRKWLQS